MDLRTIEKFAPFVNRNIYASVSFSIPNSMVVPGPDPISLIFTPYVNPLIRPGWYLNARNDLRVISDCVP